MRACVCTALKCTAVEVRRQSWAIWDTAICPQPLAATKKEKKKITESKLSLQGGACVKACLCAAVFCWDFIFQLIYHIWTDTWRVKWMAPGTWKAINSLGVQRKGEREKKSHRRSVCLQANWSHSIKPRSAQASQQLTPLFPQEAAPGQQVSLLATCKGSDASRKKQVWGEVRNYSGNKKQWWHLWF